MLDVPVGVDGPAAERGPHGVWVRYPYNPRFIVVGPEHLSPVAILGRQETKLPTRGLGLLPVQPSPHHSATRTHQPHCDPVETRNKVSHTGSESATRTSLPVGILGRQETKLPVQPLPPAEHGPHRVQVCHPYNPCLLLSMSQMGSGSATHTTLTSS